MIQRQRMNELQDKEIRAMAPSVFQEAHLGTKIYKHISTFVVINIMRETGWKPVWASEKKCRKSELVGYQKHMIAFKKQEGAGWLEVSDGVFPEIVLTNSHDCKASYMLQAGLFRLICSNGMVVADSTIQRQNIRHVGFDPEQVVHATYRIGESVPVMAGKIKDFQSVNLLPFEKSIYAKSALIAKHNPKEQEDFEKLDGNAILNTRRYEDRKDDLWSVYNTVQENLLKGGRREIVGKNRTKEVKAIDKNIALNKALWHLTERMYETKQRQAV